MKAIQFLLTFFVLNLVASAGLVEVTAATTNQVKAVAHIGEGASLTSLPVANIKSPVVHKAEFANVYLSDEVDFPAVVNSRLGLVVWRASYQFVLVDQYDVDTHAIRLTLGVAGSAIKGFNLDDDNSAKLYLMDDVALKNGVLVNVQNLHATSIQFLASEGRYHKEHRGVLKTKPPAIANLQFQGLWLNGEYPYYYFPDDMGRQGGLRWEYRPEGSLTSFSYSRLGSGGSAKKRARIRVYNDAGVLLRTEDITGNTYQYNDRRSYQDGNFQYLTFEISALKDGVESESISHRVRRKITELYINNLRAISEKVKAGQSAKFYFQVDAQTNVMWSKAFRLSGEAQTGVFTLSAGAAIAQDKKTIDIAGGVKRVTVTVPTRRDALRGQKVIFTLPGSRSDVSVSVTID